MHSHKQVIDRQASEIQDLRATLNQFRAERANIIDRWMRKFETCDISDKIKRDELKKDLAEKLDAVDR